MRKQALENFQKSTTGGINMDKRWVISRVSTPEYIIEKIKTKMAQPVGIVLFGADCDFKNEVVEELIKAFDLRTGSDSWGFDYEYGQCYPKTEDHLKYRFGEGRKVAMVILNSDNSADREVRHGFIRTINNAGGQSVVGIYVEARKASIRPLISNFEYVEFNKQIAAIERSNPTADDLDYLITVNEEGGVKLW